MTSKKLQTLQRVTAPVRSGRRAFIAAAALVLGGATAASMGAELTQTVSVPAETLFDEVTADATRNLDLSATFDRFDPALGELTRIDVEHFFDFDLAVESFGGQAGGGLNSSGTLKINDALIFSGNGGGNGTGTNDHNAPPQVFTAPFNIANVDMLIPGTAAPAWIDAFVAPGGGGDPTVRVTYDGDANARITIAPASVTGALKAGSFIKVTYVYDAASLTGDYNNSGQVEQGDLDLVLQNWGTDTTGNTPPGWTNDLPTGLVDQGELDGVLLNWGSSAAPGFNGGAVPEPAAAVFLLPAALRHRRQTRRA